MVHHKLDKRVIDYIKFMFTYGEQIDKMKPDIVRKNFEFAKKIGKILTKELLTYKLAGGKRNIMKSKKRQSILSNMNEFNKTTKKIKII